MTTCTHHIWHGTDGAQCVLEDGHDFGCRFDHESAAPDAKRNADGEVDR